MDVDMVRESGALIFKPEGHVDGSNSQEFQQALETAITDDDSAVIMELERLTYISSAGLRVILTIGRALQQRGAKLAICALSPGVSDVFQVSGFDQLLTVTDSREEALRLVVG